MNRKMSSMLSDLIGRIPLSKRSMKKMRKRIMKKF
ncbi:DUF3918 family protein [Metabacillus idriensis]